MTLSELLDYTRKYVLRDMRKPYKWEDVVVVQRLDEAQKKAAIKTHSFVVDDRELYIEPDEAVYALDDDIVHVYSARFDGSTTRLQASTEGWTPNDLTKSQPSRYTLDRRTQSIRFYPIPDDYYTLILHVSRLPATLTLDGLNDDVELKDQYQLCLADWVAYRCFNDDDADGLNADAAARAKGRFYEAIGDIKRDEYRLRTGQTPRAHGQRVK